MNRVALDIDEVFFAALEIEGVDARSAYLDEVCGVDAGLRHNIDELLAVNPLVNSFLETPAVASTATIDAPCAEAIGTFVGPYKILEQIGEGGMGTVYVAEQARPVRRRVALKLIKPGMDTKQVLARFEAERQALALMDHPNIAKVFDAGATEAGRPYFIMELVKGIPITDYCDRARLSVPDRLELFVLVCRAVQHAHQKGIIHRDLKPSNILVTVIDGVAVPKVIDFGVAKSTGPALAEGTLYTGFAQLVGTPLYMSPEQAALSGVDVDTRSDVYALGVLLYELLTGTTPIDRETLHRVAYDEVRRIVREQDPPTPSTRLGTLGEAQTAVSTNRHTDSRKLSHAVQGDLDWIVMKALEKDRTQRYETANDFAADVMRHLTDQPVQACPPSAWYRLRKAARRNQVALATSAVIGVALIGGTAISVWQSLRASSAERKAEGRYEIAKAAVDEYLIQVTQDAGLQHPNSQALRRRLLEAAAPFYERLAEQEPLDADGREARGIALHRLGHVRSESGDHMQARTAHQRALTVLTDLAAESPAVPGYRRELADTLHCLGHNFKEAGLQEDARRHHQHALSLREALLAELPTDPEIRHLVALSHRELSGVLPEAAEQVRHLQLAMDSWEQLAKEDPSMAACRMELAASHVKLAALVESAAPNRARMHHQTSIQIRQRLASDFPGPAEQGIHTAHLSEAHFAFAITLQNLGAWSEARSHLELAIRLMKERVAKFPHAPQSLNSRLSLGRQLNQLVQVLETLDRPEEARDRLDEAIQIREALVRECPTVAQFAIDLAGSECNRGLMLAVDGEDDKALSWFARAEDRLVEVLRATGSHPTGQEYLRNAHYGMAHALARLGRLEEAIEHLRLSGRKGEDAEREFRDLMAHLAAEEQGRLVPATSSLIRKKANKTQGPGSSDNPPK